MIDTGHAGSESVQIMRDADRVLTSLGYIGDRDFVTDPEDQRVRRHRHAIRSAFAGMDVIGAFCPTSHMANGGTTAVPLVYVVVSASQADADRAHRSIWSQSLVPLMLVVTPEGVQVRNAFNPAEGAGRLVPWSDWHDGAVHPALAGIAPAALRSSLSWQHFGTAQMNRVDTRLYRTIRELNTQICGSVPALADQRALANALIGRMLYLLVLTDRKVITQEHVSALKDKRGRPLCPDISLISDGPERLPPWPAKQFWALMDSIDTELNGSIFPISKAERECLGDTAIDLARNVLRRDDALEHGALQLGFLDIDYAALRTETISAIYEQFFAVEDAEQKAADGAFYTPVYLVDYVLDELDGIDPLTPDSRVCDPAAGSGAFLVSAFRRIVERLLNGRAAQPAELRDVLQKAIFGMETNAQAANVARFSLYLTMLDYLPGLTFQMARDRHRLLGEPKLFPDMRENVRIGDFFEPMPPKLRRKATHVIGNPPWTKLKPHSPADHYRQTLPSEAPVSYGNLAELFTWRAIRELAAPDGAVALVMSARSFIGSRVPESGSFPSSLAQSVRLHGITNLSHFRRKLFEKAGEPAVVIFASNRPPNNLDRTWRYSPLLTSQPLDKNGSPWSIVVDRGAIERTRQIDLFGSDRDWFHNLMLQPLDRVFARRLATNSELSLGAFMRRVGLRIDRGGYEQETGIPRDYHLGVGKNRQNYLARLGLVPGHAREYDLPRHLAEQARPPFNKMFAGNILLIPRAHNQYDFVAEPVAFNSSIQGLYFADDKLSAAVRHIILTEIGHYFTARAVRYLMALVGKAWMLEQRRFEASDMERLPFPYASVHELVSAPPSTLTDLELTRRIAASSGLGEQFERAVEDHAAIRIGYQNGKVPAIALTPVTNDRRSTYESVLATSLNALFSDSASISVSRPLPKDKQPYDLLVSIAPHGSKVVDSPPKAVERDLAESAAIEVSSSQSSTIVRLSKTPAVANWTVDRAYSDAIAIVQNVLAR